MVDYNYSDRKYKDLAEKLLIPAFRNMALSYCVDRSDIYEALELYDALCRTEDDETLLYEEAIRKYRLRIIRLIKRLNVEETKDENNDVFFLDKVYDSKLHLSMVSSYLPLAKMIDDCNMQTVPLNIVIRSLAVEDREKFSVVEFALLVCLLISVKGRSVDKINRPITTENELKRAKPRLKKIKEGLFSKKLEIILLNLILNILSRYYQKDYEDTLCRYLTDFWLPESKRHLKTSRYAVKRYGGKIVKSHYSEEDLEKLSPGETMQLFETNERISRLQWLFFVILPICQAFFEGGMPRNICENMEMKKGNLNEEGVLNIDMREYLLGSHLLDSKMKEHIKNMPSSSYTAAAEDFLVARKLCDAVTEYIAGVRKAVVQLLETLPEAKIAGKIELWEYLSNL